MNIILPILLFLTPLLISLKLCGWPVTAAFIISIVVVPFCMVLFVHLIEVALQTQKFNFRDCVEIGAMFSFAGIPIYFLLILPLYYLLRSSTFPFYITFPCSVSAVMLALCFLIAERPLTYLYVMAIIACSILHSLLITWLIAKFNAF